MLAPTQEALQIASDHFDDMLAKLVRPHHLKLFFSNRFVHASIIAKQNNVCVASTSTNNATFRKLLGLYAPKNREEACEEVAKVLAKKAAAKKVHSVCALLVYLNHSPLPIA